mgnify:CR=1 FL=1
MGDPPTYSADVGATENVENARVMLRGSVKWDHCMNLNFAEGNFPFHFCEKEQAVRIGAVLGRLYHEAEKLLGENWDS